MVRGELADAPPRAVWAEDGSEAAVLCVLERDAPAGEGISALEAGELFAGIVTAFRLWAPGFVSLGGPAWQRRDEGEWLPVPVGHGLLGADASTWVLPQGEVEAFQDFFSALDVSDSPQTVAWALRRFEMGCERMREDEALSDHLLAVRALLAATDDPEPATLAQRIAALCAEEGAREEMQDRIEAAMALERFIMGGGGLDARAVQPRELAAEVETHLRALLRDVSAATSTPISRSWPTTSCSRPRPSPTVRSRPATCAARRSRSPSPDEPDPEPEPEPEPDDPDTAEMEPVSPEPPLEGVTASSEWSFDDPEDYSAPV